MEHKLIITKKENRIITFQLEDDILVKVSAEREEGSLLQNIYVGKVQNVVKNINAAFVEIKKGVLCYLPLTESDRLSSGDELLVQVVRDPVKTKEASVSTNLSLSGKYAVVSYPNLKVGYSSKLSLGQKKYFRENLTPFLNSQYGCVIRTNAASLISRQDGMTLLKREIEELTAKLVHLLETAPSRQAFSLLYQTPGKHLEAVKNLYMGSCQKIMTDDSDIYEEIKQYLQENQPEDLSKLVLYQDASLPMTKLLRLDAKLQEAMQKNVWLKSGGYLVIEPTEALTVIDVNTGKYLSGKNREETFYRINMEAVVEIAHQIRLRNISGMIVIDFINLAEENKKNQLMLSLREAVLQDPIRTTVLDITALGLVEITRKKVEAPLWEQLS